MKQDNFLANLGYYNMHMNEPIFAEKLDRGDKSRFTYFFFVWRLGEWRKPHEYEISIFST